MKPKFKFGDIVFYVFSKPNERYLQKAKITRVIKVKDLNTSIFEYRYSITWFDNRYNEDYGSYSEKCFTLIKKQDNNIVCKNKK